jgi:hypothetical protein
MIDIIDAKYIDAYRIEVFFENGRSGIVDLSDYAARGGVFQQFSDMVFFCQFKVNRELGTLTWGNDVDIAPETLYKLATGEPWPVWMEPQDNSKRQVAEPDETHRSADQ